MVDTGDEFGAFDRFARGVGFVVLAGIGIFAVVIAIGMLGQGCSTMTKIATVEGNSNAILIYANRDDAFMVCLGGSSSKPTLCHQLGELRRLPLRRFD